jgi:hypothetical protein
MRTYEPPAARLNVDEVEEIRERWLAGERITPLAREFGVTYQTIKNVAWNLTWTDDEYAARLRGENVVELRRQA